MDLQANSVSQLTYAEMQEHLRLAKINPGHYAHLLNPLLREQVQRNPLKQYQCQKCSHPKCHTLQPSKRSVPCGRVLALLLYRVLPRPRGAR
jgi:hypothetical protein